jgi:hypothetical protein
MKFAGCKKFYDGKLKMQKREAIKDPDVDIPGTAARPRWLGGGLETKIIGFGNYHHRQEPDLAVIRHVSER